MGKVRYRQDAVAQIAAIVHRQHEAGLDFEARLHCVHLNFPGRCASTASASHL